jgi:hypothetical protein
MHSRRKFIALAAGAAVAPVVTVPTPAEAFRTGGIVNAAAIDTIGENIDLEYITALGEDWSPPVDGLIDCSRISSRTLHAVRVEAAEMPQMDDRGRVSVKVRFSSAGHVSAYWGA